MPTAEGSFAWSGGSNQPPEENVSPSSSSLPESLQEHNETLQIRVKMVNEQVHWISTSTHTTTKEFRGQIEQATHVPIDAQRLIYRGKLLRDDLLTLGAYKLQDGHTVHLITRPAAMASASSSSMAVAATATATTAVSLGATSTTGSAVAQPNNQAGMSTHSTVSATAGEPTGSPERLPIRVAIRRPALVPSSAATMEALQEARQLMNEDPTMQQQPDGDDGRLLQFRRVESPPVSRQQQSPPQETDPLVAWPDQSAVRHPLRVDHPPDRTDFLPRDATPSPAASPLASTHETNLDHLRQGIMTLRTILSTQPPLSPTSDPIRTQEPQQEREQMHVSDGYAPTHEQPEVPSPQFFVGQWIDVRDTVNQWLECTVLEISTTQVLVHYHGWPSRWDEWIDKHSDRLAAFRTRTEHQLQIDRVSPMPRTRFTPSTNGGSRDHADTTAVPTPGSGSPATPREEIRQVIPQLRDMMRDLLPYVESLAALCEEDREAMDDARQSEVSQLAHFLAPAFDRFGRLLTDSARAMTPLVGDDLRRQIEHHRTRGNAEEPRQEGETSVERDQRLEPEHNERVTHDHDHDHDHDDWHFAVRDLITTPSQMPFPAAADTRPRGSIDVHIHAIVAPSSLGSLLNLARSSVRDSLNSGLAAQEIGPRARASSGARLVRELGLEEMNQPPSFSASVQRQRQREQEETARQVSRLLQVQRRQREHWGRRTEENSSESTPLLGSYARTMSAPESFASVDTEEAPSHRRPYEPPPNIERRRHMIPEVAEAQARHTAAFGRDESRSEDGPTAAIASASDLPRPTFLEVLRRTLSGVRDTLASLNSPPRPEERERHHTSLSTGGSADEDRTSERGDSSPGEQHQGVQTDIDMDMESLPDLESLD